MRLQKFIAACGVASRRGAERMIESGRVTVNGATAHVGQVIDPDTDDVLCDGVRLCLDQKVYVVLNKPRGVVTTVKDTHDRRIVLDCLRGVKGRVFPVGRLDMDVDGVLLLTNDGDLAHRLTHPSYQIDKVYLASVQGSITDEAVSALEAGVMLEDGPASPAEVCVVRRENRWSLVRLTLREGRKREVKRMCAAVGHPVLKLSRIAVDGIRAEPLQPGEWRYLEEEEVDRLRHLVGL